MRVLKKFLPLIILAAGAGIIAMMLAFRQGPALTPPSERAQVVETIVVEPMTVVPRVTTYGEVMPARTWSAVAQVSGRVVAMSPKLKDGEFVDAGEELVRIDEQEYQLALNMARADVEKSQARLRELVTSQGHLREQVELHRQALSYNERELERQENLYQSRAVSASVVEQQQISVLEQRRSLANLEASYELIPSQIEYQRAEVTSAESTLRQAELNLGYTIITAPFRGRVDASAVEVDQYVASGQTICQVDAIDQAEIVIGVSQDKLAMLTGLRVNQVMENIARDSRPDPQNRPTYEVLVDAGGGYFRWQARFGRVSASVDPATRMTEIVIVVDDPYQIPQPGQEIRPPLSKGTFCTVLIRGRPQADQIVVPRRAVHEGSVYVVTDGSRLEIRPVRVKYYLDSYAILDGGVTAGEQLAISDIVPAVGGMLLQPLPDAEFPERAGRDIGPAANGEADDA